jgi:hypothetical protein
MRYPLLNALKLPLSFLAVACLFLAIVLANGGLEALAKYDVALRKKGAATGSSIIGKGDFDKIEALGLLLLELRRADRCSVDMVPADQIDRCAEMHSCLMAHYDNFDGDDLTGVMKQLGKGLTRPNPSLWDVWTNIDWIRSGDTARVHISMCNATFARGNTPSTAIWRWNIDAAADECAASGTQKRGQLPAPATAELAKVKTMFMWAWDSYRKLAWGSDSPGRVCH